MLKTTLAAAAVTVGHAAHASGTGFQATIGSPSDFPGATGLAYRYLDAYDSSDVDGGWVIGGWAQHASAIARVGENGTVLWSHKMHYKHPDHPGDEDGQTALSDVAALPDGGAAFVGYAYYVVPSKTQCFVGRLSPAGEIIYLNDYSSSGGAGWDSCVLSGIVSNGDQSVLVIGEDKADGAFSAQLDKAGKPLSGWAVGADGLQFKSVSGGDGVRLADDSYVYSFNGDVPNRRQLQGGIPTGFWGLMHLNSSGAPIASHHFGDTKWGHNCIVAAVPTDQGAATGPESGGFILAGNLEQPQSVNSEKPYDTSLLVMRVASDFKTVMWSKQLDGLPDYIDDDSSQAATVSADGSVVRIRTRLSIASKPPFDLSFSVQQVAVVGMSKGDRAMLLLLDIKDGHPVAPAVHYGANGTESRLDRIVSTQDGGLLMAGDQRGITYLVKTKSLTGDSGCASHQQVDTALPPLFDAKIAAEGGAPASAPAVVRLVARASRLTLEPWSKGGFVDGCGPK